MREANSKIEQKVLWKKVNQRTDACCNVAKNKMHYTVYTCHRT